MFSGIFTGVFLCLKISGVTNRQWDVVEIINLLSHYSKSKGMINIEQILKLISPMAPSVNHYLGWRAIIKNGKPMAMSYKTSEATKYQKEFQEYVKQEVKKQNWSIPVTKTQHFYVDADFYFDRVDKDASNYDKCLLDAITESKCIWEDDNVVCMRVNRIYYDSKNPRIELKIYPTSYIGIFDNRAQLETFTSNCIQCTRYKEGKCSLLVKSKEGRIQPEISNLICEKYKTKL